MINSNGSSDAASTGGDGGGGGEWNSADSANAVPCSCGASGLFGSGGRTIIALNKMDVAGAAHFVPRCPNCAGVLQPHHAATDDGAVSNGNGVNEGNCSTAAAAAASNGSDVYGNGNTRIVRLSCKTGEGVPELMALLEEEVGELCAGVSGDASLSTVRHRAHVEDCIVGLGQALENPGDVVFVAESLRHASHQFSYITGRFDMEEVMDVIFSEFCIGK
jgi:tRNA U34 5-carboxymethylaminomethyl modifying GTPase MnmE/TrmE